MPAKRRPTPAFTLVEVLVVILIISILIALLIPTVRGVLASAQRFRIAADLSQLERAVHAYKEKYGDFPPDFSDARAGVPFQQTVAYRHIRKVWQRIDPAELNIIATYAKTIDTAEALVFWLGGLSDNPKRPFTGAGGPLYATGDSAVPYAWRIQERNSPIFNFDEGRLSLEKVGDYVVGASYVPQGQNAPFVYFDARTYAFINNGNPEYAFYQFPSPDGSGVTRVVAYKSTIVNSNPKPPFYDSEVHFVNRDTFQIISAGLDDMYGPVVGGSAPTLIYNDDDGNPVPLFTTYPTFKPYHPNLPGDTSYYHYQDGQRDNMANFTEGSTLEDAQP